MRLTAPPQPFKTTRNEKSPTRVLIEKTLLDNAKHGGIGTERIASLTGIDIATVRRNLAHIRDANQLFNLGTPNKPLYVLQADKPSVPTVAKPVKFVPKDTYDGAELRPYVGRPGAMDAYKLPSLKNGQHIPYNGIRPQLVGALKDNSNNAR